MSQAVLEMVEIVCPHLIEAPEIWNALTSAIYDAPIVPSSPLAAEMTAARDGLLCGVCNPDAVAAISEAVTPMLFMAADCTRAVGVLARDASTIHAAVPCVRAVVESAGKIIWALNADAPPEEHAMRAHVLMQGDPRFAKGDAAAARARAVRNYTTAWFDADLPKHPSLTQCARELERRVSADERLYSSLSMVTHSDTSWFYTQLQPEGVMLAGEELAARLWLSFAAFGEATKHVASFHEIDAVVERVDASLDAIESACNALREVD